MQFVPVMPSHAAELTTWAYPPPYDCYDLTAVDQCSLCDPGDGFFAVLRDGELIAFRSFGADGQVPGGDYDASALDTGGGLRPDLVGRGLGVDVVRAGLQFGADHFAPEAFRVTVAAFNARALRTVRRLGFVEVSRFTASADAREFLVLTRNAERDTDGHAGASSW